MATVKLGIHRDYVPGWGVWEGVRDLVQNALDADDKGYSLSVHEYPKSNRIRLHNKGGDLPREALAIGFSTKADDSSQRGQYGEGLKLAMLALLRMDIRVRLYTGGKSYTPEFVYDDNLGCEVLAIKIGSAPKRVGEVSVVFENLPVDDWRSLKGRFSRWAGFKDTVSTPSGTLIRDPEAKGMVFVKGIYVCNDDSIEYGYDVVDCKLDRDRKIPVQWDLEFAMSNILASAVQQDKLDAKSIVKMYEDGATDVRQISEWGNLPARNKIAAEVKKKYPDADGFAYSQHDASAAPDGVNIKVLPSKMSGPMKGLLKDVHTAVAEYNSKPESVFDDDRLNPEQRGFLTDFRGFYEGVAQVVPASLRSSRLAMLSGEKLYVNFPIESKDRFYETVAFAMKFTPASAIPKILCAMHGAKAEVADSTGADLDILLDIGA